MRNKDKFVLIGLIVIIGFFLSACDNETTPTTAETVIKPIATPAGGNYSTSQIVTLSTATEGADIHYTLNGSTPTASSAKYDNPITISTTSTLKAIAVKSGMNDSEILTETYTISSTPQVSQPVTNLPSGAVTSGTEITLTTSTSGATIYYTTNGDTPTAESTEYTIPIIITVDTTIKAIAVKDDLVNSDILEIFYTIAMPVASIFYNLNSTETEVLQNGSLDAYETAAVITQSKNIDIIIKNTGTATLIINISGITITGTDSSAYQVTTNPDTDILAGSQTSLTISFTPVKEGSHNATLSIPTNDNSRNPIIIGLQARGEQGAAVVELSQNGVIIPRNGQFNFGNVDVNETYGKDVTFIIRNSGNINLSYITVNNNRINTASNTNFQVIMQPSSSMVVAPGNSGSFTIRFKPTSTGEFTTTVSFETNDKLGAFSFTVKGVGK